MSAFMQKRNAEGQWENIPVIGMGDDSDYPGLVNYIYSRDEIHSTRHWDWLGLGTWAVNEAVGNLYTDPMHSKPKGFPTDLGNVERSVLDLCTYGYNWHLVDDLLLTDWDVVRPCKDTILDSDYTLRDYLGQPFIDWLGYLKTIGVERIVCAF